MTRRALMVATVPSMIGQFNMNNIRILHKLGYEIDIATDFQDTSVWPKERVEQFKESMRLIGVRCFQISFSRSPFKVKRHFCSYKEVKQLIKQGQYSIVHTHTPIASAIVRYAARSMHTTVIYTAHGFHFYSGAPLLNWIIFYPLEKWMSHYTDILITINKEDYAIACKKFKAKHNLYVPGVGVDVERFTYNKNAREKIRSELQLPDKQLMFLSVGELNENKNHETIIRALKGEKIAYVIVGKGALKERLTSIAKDEGINLRLTGFRKDVADFYSAADVYVLPSLREGLNVSLMEAMASGLPVICGKIRGNVDLIDHEKGGRLFNPSSEQDAREQIALLLKKRDSFKNYGRYNQEKIQEFSTDKVDSLMENVYQSCIDK